jgi:hypothetical protein
VAAQPEYPRESVADGRPGDAKVMGDVGLRLPIPEVAQDNAPLQRRQAGHERTHELLGFVNEEWRFYVRKRIGDEIDQLKFVLTTFMLGRVDRFIERGNVKIGCATGALVHENGKHVALLAFCTEAHSVRRHSAAILAAPLCQTPYFKFTPAAGDVELDHALSTDRRDPAACGWTEPDTPTGQA